MTNFAKEQLLKYGWTEGKGLGKNENGIVEALKPKLKFDTTGVGHDASEYQWWEYVYNKAANNLDIDSCNNEIQVRAKDKNAVEIATSKSELNLRRIKKDHSLHFGSFIKTSTLQDGKDSKNDQYQGSAFDQSASSSFPLGLNDEELFKACRGRTAHKGARHGVTCNGKLARIQRQEQELLMRLQNPEKETTNSTDWVQVESKKRKRNKNKEGEKMDLQVDPNIIDENDAERKNGDLSIRVDFQNTLEPSNTSDEILESSKIKSKKSRLKEKRKIENLSHKLESALDISNDIVGSELRGINKKSSSKYISSDTVEIASKSGKSKKKKRKFKSLEAEDAEGSTLDNIADIGLGEEISDRDIGGPIVKKLRVDANSNEADKLNHRIIKKKKKKLEKKTAEKLEKISEGLQTLDLKNEIVDEDQSRAKKKKKKSKHKS